MTILRTQGIDQFYETFGDINNPAVLLVSGLGGTNKSWTAQIKRFEKDYYVIAPDHRGTGYSTHTTEGHTIQQLALDMEDLLDDLKLGPVHVVGASTGGAIAQYMAVDRPDQVKSLTLSSTFIKFDPWMTREFKLRRKMAAEWDRETLLAAYSQYLFSPKFTNENPDFVQSWIDMAAGNNASGPNDAEIGVKRIDMIANHDFTDRIQEIKQPTLILCGEANACTDLQNSEKLHAAIKGSRLKTFPGCGELIETEVPDQYFAAIDQFISTQA
ncbi:alpha/beta fold hydrolase [Secundilactobacillus folii]|uniref:Alpha/beta fold hydrolase n=1 Tax=Secundilactobacillus folii TaxID=2678357 RepID=A0A7X2XV04_9LACO|nr:alpha/beta hydrolase [Secundilactobacillus folii]MTV82128.1 alpha/beta fold hydrolase [Secundilactobacillus folii]